MKTRRTAAERAGASQAGQGTDLSPLSQFNGIADGFTYHAEPVSGVNNDYPDDVRHPRFLRMSADTKMSRKNVDNILSQIEAQVGRVNAGR